MPPLRLQAWVQSHRGSPQRKGSWPISIALAQPEKTFRGPGHSNSFHANSPVQGGAVALMVVAVNEEFDAHGAGDVADKLETERMALWGLMSYQHIHVSRQRQQGFQIVRKD